MVFILLSWHLVNRLDDDSISANIGRRSKVCIQEAGFFLCNDALCIRCNERCSVPSTSHVRNIGKGRRNQERE